MPSPRGAPVAVVLRDGSVLVLGGMGMHEHDMPMAGAYYWGGPTCPPRTADAVRFVPAR
jgi:hypothetical protein